MAEIYFNIFDIFNEFTSSPKSLCFEFWS